MSLIINGIIEDEVTFNTNGTHTFTLTPPIASNDIVVIVIRDGECLSAREGVVSATSDPSDPCSIPMTIPCWVDGNTDIVNGLTVYTDMSMLQAYKFVGDGDFYHIILNDFGQDYSTIITNAGLIDTAVPGICL
jgi:hypothetical protein